jgi:pilus assembly protein CpaE
VLGGEEPLEETLFLSPNGISMLFAAIQPDFTNIVIDLPRTLVTGQRALLERMSHIMVVSDLSLSGMRDTVRLKALARESAPEVPVHVVVVEGQDRRNAISKADFERGIEDKIAQVVPFDSRTADEAASNGKAVPATGGGRRPLVKSLRQIAGSVAVIEETKKRKKWFGK